jgi:hypothetical protein
MWSILLFATVSASHATTLRFHYGRSITHLVWPYTKCVVDRDKGLPPRSVEIAFKSCHSVRKSALKRASDARQRLRVNAALADFEARYLRGRFANTDLRD